MTVKELEERTGLSRANIRFYEQEGLLTPRRRANGYRDYREEDLTALLRIKLLRQLDVPLEEIRRLILDEDSLGALMARQAAFLAGEGLRLAAAREVCEEIRRQGLSYTALTPDPYLRRLAHTPAPPTPPDVADRAPPCPWRRYFARILDMNLYTTIYMLIAILVFLQYDLSGLGWDILFTLLGFGTMLLVEPLLLSRWGTTPGKWLLGLRVEACDGGRLTYGAAQARTVQAIWQGMGANLPIYQIITLCRSYRRCADNCGPLPWEEESVVAARKQRPLHIARYLIVWASGIAVLVLAVLSLLLPPNRGVLTREAYIQNYNYYMRLLDTSCRLSKEGELKYFGIAGTARVEIAREGVTRFSFQEEDGLLTAVTVDFDCRCVPEYADDTVYCAPGGERAVLHETGLQTAFWAAAGAVTPLTEMGALAKQIETMTGEHYGFVWQGISVSFHCEANGFQPLYEGSSVYLAEHPDETSFVTARLTIQLPWQPDP